MSRCPVPPQHNGPQRIGEKVRCVECRENYTLEKYVSLSGLSEKVPYTEVSVILTGLYIESAFISSKIELSTFAFDVIGPKFTNRLDEVPSVAGPSRILVLVAGNQYSKCVRIC